MGRTRKNPTPGGKRADEHLELQLAEPNLHTAYFRDKARLLAHARTRRKGIYFVNGKSSGFLTAYHVQSKESTDIASADATQPAISPDGKHVMYIALAAGKMHELWVADIDGGNKVKVATGEYLETGTWAADSFHLSFQDAGTGSRGKAYIAGADGSGLHQLPAYEVQHLVRYGDLTRNPCM
jgi:Tol biopolymer transport system component